MAVDDTRDKILNVANSLFSRFGFHKTSMDEIAKIARKAKGSLYYHFTNKEINIGLISLWPYIYTILIK